MKRAYIFLLILLSIILTLFSCGKDNDFDPNDYEKNIIGKWELVYEYRWRRIPGREPEISENDKIKDKTVHIFKENDSLTYQMSINYSGQEIFFEHEMLYKIVDGRIITDHGEYDTAEKILSLTPTELKTEVHFMDTDGKNYQEIYSLYTYERR